MTHLDLFSGIGGFALAARWMGWETVQFVEIDGFCQKVLNKHWPNVPIHGDIKTFDGTKFRGTVDILTGGFPCQPFSCAGKQQGTEDERHLWPEMLRVIAEIQPAYIVGENVYGLVSWSGGLVFDQVQTALEALSYDVQSCILPACAVKGAHRRDRVWIVAHHKGQHLEKSEMVFAARSISEPRESTQRLPGDIWAPDKQTNFSEMVGELHGVSDWVDRSKSLGNAIVPQVAFEIFKAINSIL